MSSISESDDANPHGFISEGVITNFKKTKSASYILHINMMNSPN